MLQWHSVKIVALWLVGRPVALGDLVIRSINQAYPTFQVVEVTELCFSSDFHSGFVSSFVRNYVMWLLSLCVIIYFNIDDLSIDLDVLRLV